MPLLVIVGWITHHDLTLFFADFEVCLADLTICLDSDICVQTIVLFVSVLLVNFLIQYVDWTLAYVCIVAHLSS